MNRNLIWCIVLFQLVFGVFSLKAADINSGLNDGVVVAGMPPITDEAIDGHIRIIEFILGTRMTIAQKQGFYKAIVEETTGMDLEDRENFVSVIDLTKSLNLLDDEQHEPIRRMLEVDYNASARELVNDPGATLYVKLQTEALKPVIVQSEIVVTRQSVEAFAEYLAFIARPDNPILPNERALDMIQTRIKIAFASLEEDERVALENFHLTWYLIRAAWQNSKNSVQKNAWKAAFTKVGIRPGSVPDVKKIKEALNIDLYADLLDMATMSGIEPIEWSTKTTIRVW
jgi:hypothetical protein